MVKTKSTLRGIPVWGARLKELRKRRGWTQQELANRSGYCERLVRKAELNGTVSEETLEVLAITLSDSQYRVSIDDLSLSSRLSANVLFAAVFKKTPTSLDQLIAHTHSKVIIDFSLADVHLPISGIFHRHHGLAVWYNAISCLFEPERTKVLEKVLLDNARFGFAHANCELHWNANTKFPFEIDLRIHFRKSLIHQIVCLSSLVSLSPFARDWEQLISANNDHRIAETCQAEHA